MKKWVSVLGLIAFLWAAPVLAGPFLVCDQQTGVDYYNITTDGIVTAKVTFQPGWVQNGKLFFSNPGGTTQLVNVLMDESPLAVGNHNQSAIACVAATLWNPEVCSAASNPLAFARPAPATAPGTPANTRLLGP